METEQEQNWYFTWGYGQAYPNKYVKIFGTHGSAREKMFERFGDRWSMQYPESKLQDLERHGITRLELAE